MASLDTALERLDEFVERQLRVRNTPGMAIGLTDRDGLLAVRCHGHADVAARLPVTPETLFEMGSIGKSFTSLMLMQLRDEGRFDPAAPITDYLPWFAVKSRFAPFNCHHLLSHTAGLITGSDFSPDQRYEVWALRETEISSPPGARFHYSNIGYKTLGLALEAIAGKPWAAAARERIFHPLGMTASEGSITHATRARLATPYVRFYDDRPGNPRHHLVPATWLETDTGDGCVASTPADLAAWLRVLLNHGQGPAGQLITTESYDLLTQRVVQTGQDPDTYYGYGLSTWREDGHDFVGHSGGMVGFYAHMAGDLTDGIGAVAMINGPGNPRETTAFAVSLLRAARRNEPLLDLPPARDPRHTPAAAEYAGVYRDALGELTLVADGARLDLAHNGERVPLESCGPDVFVADHADFDRYTLNIQRDADGRVVELTHGPRWLVADAYADPATFDYPTAWDAYPGHYRSHNPWAPNFRVVRRKGMLLLIWPSEPDGFAPDEVLVPLEDGSFRVGEDEGNPERVRFDTIVDGVALRANLSGCDYYRFFTP